MQKYEADLAEIANASAIAGKVAARYGHLRALTIIARLLEKALFAGRSDNVIFWAVVYAHYRGRDLGPFTPERVAAFRKSLMTSLLELELDRTEATDFRRRQTRR